MSDYDPFQRGRHPVGVRSAEWTDEARDRQLPVELWYPAVDAHRGQDLDPEHQDRYQPLPMAPATRQAAVRDAEPHSESCALVVFSHGYGGERRQTTHFCTHLASHGYLVASVDHVGNTTADMLAEAMSIQSGRGPADPLETFHRFIEDRPRDASFVVDQLLGGEAPVPVEAEQIGITGHSFGGWTTLQTAGRDPRIRAALPLAPAGGDTPLTGMADGPNPISESLDLDWEREVPTLFLVADLDTLLPLDGMRGLIDRTPAPRRAVVLRDTDHFHFCDGAAQVHDLMRQMGPMLEAARPDGPKMFSAMKPASELSPEEHAVAAIQGLGLAHLDAHVRGLAEAAALIEGDLEALLGARGISAEQIA